MEKHKFVLSFLRYHWTSGGGAPTHRESQKSGFARVLGRAAIHMQQRICCLYARNCAQPSDRSRLIKSPIRLSGDTGTAAPAVQRIIHEVTRAAAAATAAAAAIRAAFIRADNVRGGSAAASAEQYKHTSDGPLFSLTNEILLHGSLWLHGHRANFVDDESNVDDVSRLFSSISPGEMDSKTWRKIKRKNNF
ncbi:unnamed protein product [Trichogramma brassicae]|uniref:Uncharacterized protein n=1 Tax=Trichogramma brassicae TaxID=86971 RepID=A0A6H5IJG9_9HYME|nr:unnamed protein product [Trichogramma brassicae]